MGINWGAALGAIGGTLIPGVGPLAGAGLGGSIFGGGKKPSVPDIKWRDGALENYGLGDAWYQIEKDFPEYAKAIRAGDMTVNDLGRVVQQLSQGPSASEKARANDYLAQQAAGQAGAGVAGTPMGNAMMADTYSRIMNPMYDQANQRALSAYGSLLGAQQQQAGLQGNAAQQALAALDANRRLQYEASLAQSGVDQNRAQLEAGYNAGRQQMYGNLINAGLNQMTPYVDMYGNEHYSGMGRAMNTMGDYARGGLGAAYNWIGNQFASSPSVAPSVQMGSPYDLLPRPGTPVYDQNMIDWQRRRAGVV